MFKLTLTTNALAALLVSSLLASCGGGGSSGGDVQAPRNDSGSQSGAGLTPSPSPAGTPAPSPTSGPEPTSPPAPGFTATPGRAPADREEVSGIVRLEVQGTALGNVELLPSTAYAPRLGTFSISEDGTSAVLDFDTASVPNGGLDVRISAFSAAPGTPGASEIIVMPARTWYFRNLPPPFGSAQGRAARCQMMGYAYTTDADPVVCLRFQISSPSVPPELCRTSFATPYAHPEDGRDVFRNGNLMPKLYCEPGANNGTLNPGCECVP